MFRLNSLLIVFSLQTAFGQETPLPDVRFSSPDEKLAARIFLNQDHQPSYEVSYAGAAAILPSRLGLVLKGDVEGEKGYALTSSEMSVHRSTWTPVLGEQSEVVDHYHQLAVTFTSKQAGKPSLTVEARCYNEGFAFRYRFFSKEPREIIDELSEFTFAGDFPLWSTREVEGDYLETKISELAPNRIRPVVVEVENGPVVALGEAGLVDSARMRFKPSKNQPHTFLPHLAGTVKMVGEFISPWRYLMVGETAGDLINNKSLVPNLNAPCAIEDTSWIRPGKAIRAELGTDQAKACVDIAVKMNFQYLLLDAGWYGPEGSSSSDATTVSVDPKRKAGDFDLPEIIKYATERKIGVFLYVNRRALERQLDTLLPLFKKWGVSGIKFGFVNVGSQEWTTWLHDAIKKCADHQLMVDVHDHYLPTGWSRTYPNLLTQEGIGGNEQMPTAEHNVILAYTRYLCGAGDYTICYHSGRLQTTRAHQLAASVVYYSPLQLIFWYDRPHVIREKPEFELFRQVSTTWDETKFIQGEIGEYVALARRKGDQWFVGVLNSRKEREISLPLEFLKEGQAYQADLYTDQAPDGTAPTKVSSTTQKVNKESSVQVKMAKNGGAAFMLTPLVKK